MELGQLIILALLQGITEFLPISSSAHLILVPLLVDWQDQGLAFDVAVHFGTLLAVVVYLRRELHCMAWSVLREPRSQTAWLAYALMGSVIPTGLVGWLGVALIEGQLRSPLVIGAATIGFGLLLGIADYWGHGNRTARSVGVRDILWMAAAQVLALIPGTSRAGITMTAGLALGLNRETAARYAFLMAIPVLVVSGLWLVLKSPPAGAPTDWFSLVLAAGLAAISAYGSVGLLLRWVSHVGLWPFVVYRLLLGAGLLWWFA